MHLHPLLPRIFLGCTLLAASARAADKAATRTPYAPTLHPAQLGALPEAKARLAAGDTVLRPAYEQVLKNADEALKVKPPSVTHKTKTPPSGSKNDYYSQAPYMWPDPTKPDGLPYLAQDGKVNPESRTEATDQQRVELFGESVDSLALAYYLSGKEAYAAHAAKMLRVWFLDPATKMNPNFEYGQAVPGKNTGRGIGIIEAGDVIDAIHSSAFLAGSPHWSAEEAAELTVWANAFLDWLLTSSHGRDEADQHNNHGTMYDVRVVRLALYVGRIDFAKSVLEQAKQRRIAAFIEPDGRQPAELRRTKSFNYSRLNLNGLASLANTARYLGVDLWNFKTEDGRSIRAAIDFMLPYMVEPPAPWPYKQILKINRAELAGTFRSAGIAYNDPRYEKVVADLPGLERSLIHISHPLPVPAKK